MLQFKEIEIEDKALVESVLKNHPRHSLEYNFTTLFIWGNIINMKICYHGGWLYVSAKKDNPSFLFPAGTGDIKVALDTLLGYCEENGFLMNFHSLSKEEAELLDSIYPDCYTFVENRNSADYVYSEERLRTLKGKKLSSKRNHINKFIEENPDWCYEDMTESNIEEAINMHKVWCQRSGCAENKSLADETCAVRLAFKYFKPLGLKGGILKANNEVVAFSIGDPLNDNTFLVHIEKAHPHIRGAYPMINQQFVIHNCGGYEFINREDDTGDEGLRKSKLSYQPYAIITKFDAIRK